MEKKKLNGSFWPIILAVLFSTNGFFLANVMIKVNKIYDTVIENKIRVDEHEKRIDKLEIEVRK